MADVAKRVDTWDHFQGDAGTGHLCTLSEAYHNLHSHLAAGKVTITIADVCATWPNYYFLLNSYDCWGEPECRYDLVFIDHSHDTESVRAVLDKIPAKPLVAIHDADYASVAEALRAAGFEEQGRVDSLVWGNLTQ